MIENNTTDQFASELKGYAETIKNEIGKTRENIQTLSIDENAKKHLLDELDVIEQSIATPGKGISALSELISKMNFNTH